MCLGQSSETDLQHIGVGPEDSVLDGDPKILIYFYTLFTVCLTKICKQTELFACFFQTLLLRSASHIIGHHQTIASKAETGRALPGLRKSTQAHHATH